VGPLPKPEVATLLVSRELGEGPNVFWSKVEAVRELDSEFVPNYNDMRRILNVVIRNIFFNNQKWHLQYCHMTIYLKG
jgi:hypothetical protein